VTGVGELGNRNIESRAAEQSGNRRRVLEIA
jgi:hypothetical protein